MDLFSSFFLLFLSFADFIFKSCGYLSFILCFFFILIVVLNIFPSSRVIFLYIVCLFLCLGNKVSNNFNYTLNNKDLGARKTDRMRGGGGDTTQQSILNLLRFLMLKV